MQASKVQINKFYTLRDGTVVKVSKKHASVSLSHAVFDVWEENGQESYQVNARELIKEVSDPTTKESFLARMDLHDPKGLNRAVQNHKAKIIPMTEAEFQAHRTALKAKTAAFSTKDVARMIQEIK